MTVERATVTVTGAAQLPEALAAELSEALAAEFSVALAAEFSVLEAPVATALLLVAADADPEAAGTTVTYLVEVEVPEMVVVISSPAAFVVVITSAAVVGTALTYSV